MAESPAHEPNGAHQPGGDARVGQAAKPSTGAQLGEDPRVGQAADRPAASPHHAGQAPAHSPHTAHHKVPAAETLPDSVVETAVGYLDMLAEPTRLRLLWALRRDELGVGALAEAAGCTPTAASQHLAKLRLSGLVDQRADGRARLYRLRGEHIRRLVEEVVGHAEHAVEGIPYEI